MPGPHPATAAIRYAVRSALADRSPGDVVLVGLSGGADSTALAAAAAVEARAAGVRAGAVVIDHGLQAASGEVAARAAQAARDLGLDPVEVVRVEVNSRGEGLEAAARQARHTAIEAVAERCSAKCVLLGHTRDDQAEQVLLGLARGSGTRSLAGMPAARGILRRPLLGVSREQTRASCRAEGLTWWEDPMNEDPAHLRVRARAALADLERDLGPGITDALARSADQLREDADHLDALADVALARLLDACVPAGSRCDRHENRVGHTSKQQGVELWVEVAELAALARPVRTRVWRRLLIAAGAPSGQVSARHTDECDRLLTQWHGQGPLHCPGDLRVSRAEGRILLRPR